MLKLKFYCVMVKQDVLITKGKLHSDEFPVLGCFFFHIQRISINHLLFMINAFQMFNNKFDFIVRFVNEIEFDEYNYHR